MKNIPRRPTLILAKIQSFTKFRDVAKCIQLVSLANLKKLKDKLSSRNISLSASKILFYFHNKSNLDLKYYENKRISFVVITTEKSCSGAINNKTNRFVLKFYQKVISVIKYANFLFIGKKGVSLIKKRFKNNLSLRLFKELEKDVNSLFISYLILNDIHQKKFDLCIIFFCKFDSGFNSNVAFYQIECFDNFLSNIFTSNVHNDKFLDLLIEKNMWDDFFFLELYYYSFCIVLLDTLEENNYSELASRAQAMESAVSNTTERIALLTLVYNKTRQALITNEIIEVLNASSAIK